jgi:rubrerythrin
VEIGAKCAYLGHFQRTGDSKILRIAREELAHQKTCRDILASYNRTPSRIIDAGFFVVGTAIFYACKISPHWALDFIARTMEMFAVVNYIKLSKMYPEHARTFEAMAQAEEAHQQYFSQRRVKK